MADSFTFLYDGDKYYATARDENTVSDEIETKVWISEHEARSEATISDAISYDTITNIIEDPGFLILRTPAKRIKDISDVRNFDVDATGNIIAISSKFIFKISPLGDLLSKKFTIPNLNDHIIDVKWFDGYLWVLFIETIPKEYYEIFNELLGLGDSANIGGDVAGGINYPYSFLNPPPQWDRQLVSAYNVFRMSKYDVTTGEAVSSFDLQMIGEKDYSYQGQYLLSPTSFDIRGNSIVIADQGDASIKSYTLQGLFTGRYSDSTKLIQPTQIVIEDDRYFWVVDSERITYLPERYRLKRFDIISSSITVDRGYMNYPFMDMLVTGTSFEKHVVHREGTTYKYYKNFIEDETISDLLLGHSVELIRISTGNYLYLFNFNPFEIRIINLSSLDTENLRECTEPITITDYYVEATAPYPDPYAEVVVADTGLQEVHLYHFYGQKGSQIIDSILPKGITKQGSVYYVTDLKFAIIYKILPGEVQTIDNLSLARPTDITNDGMHLYTLDTGNNKIYKTDFDGNIVKEIGSTGYGEVEFNYPEGISIYGEELYVLDSANFRVQVLDKEGEFQRQFLLSEETDVIYLPQTQVIELAGDQDDVWEKSNGQAIVFGDNYLNYTNGFLLTAYQFSVNLKGIRVRDAKLRLLKKDIATRIDVSITIEDTANALPYRSTGAGFADILYRNVYNDTIRWTTETSVGEVWIETIDFSTHLQRVLDKLDWVPGNKVSIILHSQLSQTDTLTLSAGIAELVLEYDLIKRTRPSGLYHAIAVDDENFYVVDLAQNKLNAYDKINGTLLSSYNMSRGTIIKPTTKDIFLTDDNCYISAINKYEWIPVESYNIELVGTGTETLRYDFEPVWDVIEEEPFERVYSTVDSEDFEWYVLTGWTLATEDEFELSVPTITWVL